MTKAKAQTGKGSRGQLRVPPEWLDEARRRCGYRRAGGGRAKLDPGRSYRDLAEVAKERGHKASYGAIKRLLDSGAAAWATVEALAAALEMRPPTLIHDPMAETLAELRRTDPERYAAISALLRLDAEKRPAPPPR